MRRDPFIAGLDAIIEGSDGLSRASVSDRAGLDTSTIRKMMANPSASPKLVTALSIAKALGMRVEEIIDAGLNGYAGRRPLSSSSPSKPNNIGFADAPEAFEPSPGTAAFDLVSAARARGIRPLVYRLPSANPDAGVVAGDMVVIDTGHHGGVGDFIIGSITDPDSGITRTVMARRYDPWLAYSGGHARLGTASGETAIYGCVTFIGRGALLESADERMT